MSKLPASLEGLASFVDAQCDWAAQRDWAAQPEKVRDIYYYCLCLMMVEAGGMELVETMAGDEGAVCVFRSAAGEEFSVVRPNISEEDEALLVAELREILRDERALAAKKAQGVVLGKPKGTIQSSMYDKVKECIKELLSLGVPQKRIVEHHLGYGTAKSLSYYIRTRNLRKQIEGSKT